jgi:hypothetical protein
MCSLMLLVCNHKARAREAKALPRKFPNNLHSNPCSNQWDKHLTWIWWTKALEACNSNSPIIRDSNPKWTWWINNNLSLASLKTSTNKDSNLAWECNNSSPWTTWMASSLKDNRTCSSSNKCTTNSNNSKTPLALCSRDDECIYLSCYIDSILDDIWRYLLLYSCCLGHF